MTSKDVASALIERYPQCKTVFAALSDQNGILRGKRYPIASINKVLGSQIRLPLSLCHVDVWGSTIATSLPDFLAGDRDGDCVWTGRAPMPTSWADDHALLIPLTMSDDSGTPFLGDPRRVLEWVLERYRKLELRPVVAVELEFYLTIADGEMPAAPRSPVTGEPLLPSSALPLSELEHFDAFIDDVYQACEAHEIQLDATIAECGAGQFEINLCHGEDVLKAADDALYFKRLVKSVAQKHDFIATFMAKPYPGQPGSGMHIHFSLLDGNNQNLFADGTARGSENLHHAIAGALRALPPSMLIFAPHLNSYRRYVSDSHAPTHVSWGYEDRSAAIRIPGGDVEAKRIEHRVAGADANPYLVTAAVLSACLQGLRSKHPIPLPHSNNGTDMFADGMLITDWGEAQQRFSQSAILKELLPEELITMFDTCKRQEVATFKNHMSAFELNTYLGNI